MDRTDKHPVREGALKRLSCWLPLLSSQLISHFRDRSWQPIIAIGDRVVNQFPPGQVGGIRDKGVPARQFLGIAGHGIEVSERYDLHPHSFTRTMPPRITNDALLAHHLRPIPNVWLTNRV